MSSIAIFSTYAPSEGFGGPARIYHQRRVLEAAGHEVTHVVVQADASRSAGRANDLIELCERPFRAPMDHMYNDVDLGRRAAADRGLVDRVRRHLARLDVSLVILEQPFLVDVIGAAVGSSIPFIYSCQNIEYRLRRDLERYQYLPDRPRNRADEVRELEARTVQAAAATTTICATDQAKLRDEFGIESVLVPNGSSVVEIPCPARPEHRVGDSVDFAFAGSSYWPNVDGFATIASPSLAFMPPTARIHVMGTVGAALFDAHRLARWRPLNESRITTHGFLPMRDLVATMRAARAVLVPVFVGEGSNLKSADALGAGVPVIMTERATHGYEDVIATDPSGVTVAEDANEFRAAMIDALRAPRLDSFVGEQRRGLLSWSSRLTPLTSVVADVVRCSRNAS